MVQGGAVAGAIIGGFQTLLGAYTFISNRDMDQLHGEPIAGIERLGGESWPDLGVGLFL